MSEKLGRNDPCSCGSGKKYKSCCMNKAATGAGKKKFTAKWMNAPQGPNLMERTFGEAISSIEKKYTPPQEKEGEKGTESQEQ